MKTAKQASRRKFLKNMGLAAGGFIIVPRHVLGRGFIAPSDKLNIAGIGAGGKGFSDLTEFAKSPNVNIVAFADVDAGQAAQAQKRFQKAKLYVDFREMLQKEKDTIDAVSVSTPDHTHAVAAMAAMQMKKHVYVQKPLTHSVYEARMLTEAARRYRVVTQMGNQGGSGNGVRRMQELVQAGLIGEVTQVYAWTNRPVWPQGLPKPKGGDEVPKNLNWDLWLGPAPLTPYDAKAYHPFNWRGWWDFGTGALGDMACHILDPAYRILPIQYPNEVECSIPNQFTDAWREAGHRDSCPPASIIHLNYVRTDGKGNIKLTWMDGGLLPQRPDELLPDEPMGNWDGGILFIGTKGKILGDCYGDNPRLLPTRKMAEVEVPTSIQRVPEGHYIQWVNACIAGFDNARTSSAFDFAGPFTESILIANLAIRSWMLQNPKMKGWADKYLGRKKLLWDAAQMRITNFDEANQFVNRPYRQGWSLGV
jgi:predicted dehydrogenase